GQNDTAKSDHPLVTDRIADNGKCFLSDLIGRGDVVGANREAIIDFGARPESVDFDRMSALDLDFFDFVVLDREVLALANLVAATNVLLFDRLAGFGIDELLLQPVSGLFVDPAERNS